MEFHREFARIRTFFSVGLHFWVTSKFASGTISKVTRYSNLEKALKDLPSVMSPVQKGLAKLSRDLRMIMAKQPPMIQLSFNNGYERALRKRLYTGRTPAFWETTSTKLYVLLLFLAPWMHQVKSVAMLHEILSKAKGAVWVSIDPKRLEKLCQRIGLKFRERGRPRNKPG